MDGSLTMHDDGVEDGTKAVDKGFGRLLEGVRTTLPGVAVLFAFLLSLPFQARFGGMSTAQQVVYVVALTCTAASSVLLIAPSVHQRMRATVDGVARKHESHVLAGAKLANAGTYVFAVALVASAWLATSFVFNDAIAAIVCVAIGGLVLWAWFWVPMHDFDQRRGR